jgi:type II secretory pathway pseudopilin PulG
VNGQRLLGSANVFGFSYVEILVAMVLIAVSLIPAMNALRIGVSSGTVQETRAVSHYELVGRLEQVLAQPFASLDAEATVVGDPKVPTGYSDAPGANNRLLVFLSAYDVDDADSDGDPFTGTDPGVLWVRVEVERTVQGFETLVSGS